MSKKNRLVRLGPGSVYPEVLNEHLVPLALKGFVSACCASMDDCHDLIHSWGGDSNFMPRKPVLLLVPRPQDDQFNVILIAAEGVTPAAELQDLAITSYGRALEKVQRNKGMLVNSAEMRDKFGLPQAEEFDALFREALTDRIARHRANLITDPPRQPVMPDTGRHTYGPSTP